MAKETVTLIDDTKVEVEINRLGFRTANKIARKHIPINNLTFNKDNTVTIQGDIDLLGMSESCLETIQGLDLDKLDGNEAVRLYEKYFKKDVMAGLGSTSNPN